MQDMQSVPALGVSWYRLMMPCCRLQCAQSSLEKDVQNSLIHHLPAMVKNTKQKGIVTVLKHPSDTK